MRRTYACLLELADPAGRDPLTARALTKRWVGTEYGGWPTDATDHWDPAPEVRVVWRVVEHHGDVAFELTWTRPHDGDPTLWRRTQVQIVTTADGDGRVVVGEGLESQDRKVRGQPRDEPGAPTLVQVLVDAVSASTAAGSCAPRRTVSTRPAPWSSTRSCAAVGDCR